MARFVPYKRTAAKYYYSLINCNVEELCEDGCGVEGARMKFFVEKLGWGATELYVGSK